MPTEVIVWVFPGILFILTVLLGTVYKFHQQEIRDLKDNNEDQNKRFQALESHINKSNNEIREEAIKMIEKSQQRSDKDIELVRADFREQMSQMREAMHRMESNIISQMKMLITAHKE